MTIRRHPRTGQRGFALMELLTAIVILGLAAGGIAAATFTAGRSSEVGNRTARLNVLMSAFGEAVKNLPYEVCGTAETYQSAFAASETSLGETAANLLEQTDATLEVTDVSSGPECPGVDNGVQTIMLTVDIDGRDLTRQVVKRNPNPNATDLDFSIQDPEDLPGGALRGLRSAVGDPFVRVGPTAGGASLIFQYDWWCDPTWFDPGNPQADPPVDAPPDASSSTPVDPGVECQYNAPADGTAPEDRQQRIVLRVYEAGTNRVGITSKLFTLPTTTVVRPPPAAQVSVVSSPECTLAAPCPHATPISFRSTAQDPPDANIIQWRWNFGDGTPEVFCSATTPAQRLVCENRDHTYLGGGTYTVTLTVTDTYGMVGSGSRNVTVNGPIVLRPVVDVDSSSNAVPMADPPRGVSAQRVCFDASGSHAAGEPPGSGITNYVWEFGDGNVQSGAALSTVCYDYPASGTVVTYDARVTVTATNGGTNFALIPVTLDPLVPPINLTNNGFRRADIPFIRNAYFDFQWLEVPRSPGDTIVYEIMISASGGFCGGLGVGTSGRTWQIPSNAGPGAVRTYRAQFPGTTVLGIPVAGFNGVCSTDTYNFRSRTLRTNSTTCVSTCVTNWSNPQVLNPEFF